MAKLNLSYDQFESYAKEFAAISSKLGDGWEERRVRVPSNPERETVFLVKRRSLLISDCSLQGEARENDRTSLEQLVSDEGLHLEEEDDPAIMCSLGDMSQHPSLPAAEHNNLVSTQNSATSMEDSSHSPPLSVHVEYHIVHSFSYEVPVLYFSATYSNGRQLSLKDTWKLLADHFVSRDMDRWGLISQQEHPLLHSPFYHIHPCHTAEVMAQATRTQTSSSDIKIHIAETKEEKRASEDSVNNLAASNNDDDASTTSGVEEEQESNVICSEPNYLVTWVSTFGPLVGLKVPLEYTIVK